MVKYNIALCLFLLAGKAVAGQQAVQSRFFAEKAMLNELPRLPATPMRYSPNQVDPDSVGYVYLDSIAVFLRANPAVKITLGGHTDSKGIESYNISLSEARAKACMRYLLRTGIAKNRLHTVGFGSCCPLVKEISEQGQYIPEAGNTNRRVEVMVTED